ncbi:MAG: sodium:solute symporter [Planctomycetes bacterium]|nr:sodium:solute symporter [Planctomycetota bacterium]
MLAITFHALDWVVLGAYLVIVLALGLAFARKQPRGDEFFLARRSMPMWAVAISVLATSQSAATFVGGPQQAYTGNLTYLSANIGVMIGVVAVAVFFIPAYYRHNVTSVYQLIGHHYGAGSQRLASGMFMLGRIFASGARLYIVAIPFALIAFGDISPASMIMAIALIAIGATAYTVAGGIRAVIWTDVLQAVVYITTIVLALALVWDKIPLGVGDLIAALKEGGDEQKLVLFDTRLVTAGDLARPYTIWAILLGVSLFSAAAFGTDQDLTQRMLTCKTPGQGSWSVIIASLIGWPVVFLFLCMGLLLYVFYHRPDIMQSAAPTYQIDDSRKVFLEFILREMPPGMRGLMLAGLFAAAMSSMDSALNAMASTAIADFYRPWRLRKDRAGGKDNKRELAASRWAILIWAILLALFAILCVFWQQASGTTLIDFALGVMVFAYSGLLAVFITALFTPRGNNLSVAAALLTGFGTVFLLQDFVWERWAPALGLDFTLAFPWKMLVATVLSFVVCLLGRRPSASSPPPPPSPLHHGQPC